MSNDLQQAVERLRKCRLGVSLYHVYEQPISDVGREESLSRYFFDFDQVADAYLAEHPADDDEPITAEWLDSLFGVEEYICTEQGGNFDEVITWIETIGNVLIPMPKTRGDFRRLCKGLKIELKEKA